MNWRRNGAVLGAAAMCAAGTIATPLALPVPSARAVTPVAAPACAGASRTSPVSVTLSGVRSAYAAGGSWSRVRMTLHNHTRAECAQLNPVLVYGARNRTLRVGAVRLETWQGGHWRSVTLNAALGELAGAVGPAAGLRLGPGQTATLAVRMRLDRAAPHGQWLSLAVAYAPLQHKGTTVAWPVGVTNPAYFRVVRARTT